MSEIKQPAMVQKIGDCEDGEVYQRADRSFIFVDLSGKQCEVSGFRLKLANYRWSSNYDIRPLKEGEVPEWMDSTQWALPDDFDGEIKQLNYIVNPDDWKIKIGQ